MKKDSFEFIIKQSIIDDFRHYQKEWLRGFINHGDDIDLSRIILDLLDEIADSYISNCIDKKGDK